MDINSFYRNNWSKISTSTLKKPVLLFSASCTLSASNLTRTYISYQLENKDITTNQNKNNTSNTYDIHSCVTPRKINYSDQATSITTHLTPLDSKLSVASVELHKTKKTAGKEKKIILTENYLMRTSVSNHG